MYGGLLIAVVLFLPQGAYPFIARHLASGGGERAARGPGPVKRFGGLQAVRDLSFDVGPARSSG
jgi:hypothetical protein